jgi:hypothetical protein
VSTWELIYCQLAPDFGDKYAAYTIEKAKKSGATDAQLAVRVKQMTEFKEMYKNPLVNVALTFLEPLPVGILSTLVTPGVLSRKRRALGSSGQRRRRKHGSLHSPAPCYDSPAAQLARRVAAKHAPPSAAIAVPLGNPE